MLKIIFGSMFLLFLTSCQPCPYQPMKPATHNLIWENEAGMIQLCVSGIARYELEQERIVDLVKASEVCYTRLHEFRKNYRKDKSEI